MNSGSVGYDCSRERSVLGHSAFLVNKEQVYQRGVRLGGEMKQKTADWQLCTLERTVIAGQHRPSMINNGK